MNHPAYHATLTPEKMAYQMASTGQSLTFKQLDQQSNQAAHALQKLGISAGDHIAFLLENRLEFMVLVWAAQRSGVIFTPVSRYLKEDEIAYIVRDCGAKVFITSDRYMETASKLKRSLSRGVHPVMIGDAADGYSAWNDLVQQMPTHPVEKQVPGASMLYSSGTTGRPKGIIRKYPTKSIDSLSPILLTVMQDMAGMSSDSTYLSPAPLYHSAPLAGAMTAAGLGASTIIMERFDESGFLDNVQQHKITHTQVVPTMFVRLLKLPQQTRNSYDVSSLKAAVHIAAPCPIEIKKQMIDWFGPILVEYYAGTEGNGVTAVKSDDWMLHEGSVGRPLIGTVHILDDDGDECPAGEIGDVYFNAGLNFEYHNDPDKTANAFTKDGWSTLGDIGWLDEDGFLYLTDRRAYTIISGGVNVYPQETEDLLITHPAVADVAVFGVPNDELGEEVKAVVELVTDASPSQELADDLIGFCKKKLSSIKTPKSVDFKPQLPRTPTGKLMKRNLKAEYWPK